MWLRNSLIAVVHLGSNHITPEKFENAALFLRLGLRFTLIHHEKRSSNRKNLKTLAFRICVDGKHFENRAQPRSQGPLSTSRTELSRGRKRKDTRLN